MKVEFISVQNLQTMQPESTASTRPMRSCKTHSSVMKLSKAAPKNQQKTTARVSKQKAGTKAKQQRINCDTCNVSFSTKKSYELHNKNYHSGKDDVCDQSLDNADIRLNRVRRHDVKAEESERYQCNICQVCFADLNELDSHVRQHFNLDIRYKCNVCDNSFFDVDHLVKHTDTVHGPTNITFNCYVCGNLFTSVDAFVKHDHEHKKLSSDLNCSECGETFSSLISLNLHKKSHTLPRTQPYACQKCSLRFSRSEDLHNHIRVHDGKAIYCCSLCDRMFAHSKNLTNHIHKSHKSSFAADEMDLIDFVVEAEVTAQLERKKLENVLVTNDNVQVDGDVFKLNVIELVSKYTKKEIPSTTHPCLTLLSTDPAVSSMTRKFTNFYRKYRCPFCELVFVKAKTLEIHCKRNHFGNYTLDQLKDIQKSADQNSTESLPRAILNCRLNVNEKHECPSCNQMYGSRQELIGHLKVDHNGNTPYKCVECSETFTTSNALAVHVLNHPDKRHECKFCGLTFMNLYSLGKHTKRHEGPNTETCPICNIPYREKKDLVKHMRIHADGKVSKLSI